MICDLFKLRTWFDKRLANGVEWSSCDSGMAGSSCPGSRNMPGHPTHNPLHRATTGATAVTSPPALMNSNIIDFK